MNCKTNLRKESLVFALIIATLTAMSCQNTTPSGEVNTLTDDTTVKTETLSLEEQRRLVDDGLPEADFNGDEFNITINTYCESGFYSEELNGDVLSDAVYERNKSVEDRFNVKLNFISDAYGTMTNTVKSSVLAGDDEYQLCAQHALNANPWVLADILVNWYDIPYADFDKPWWSESNINDLTYNKVALLAVGDFSLTTIGRTYAIYFDKVYADSYKLPDMYELVYNGSWTIDKLSELSKDIYTDLNQNNKRDFEDIYGYTTSVASNIGAYLFTFGEKIIEDGEIVLDVGKTADIIEKLIAVTQVNPGTYYDLNYKNSAGNPHYVGAEKMALGTTLFASAMIESGINYLRDSGNDYGIIPYPKWNEEQSDYITIVDGGFTVLAVPKTVADRERTGIIAEALCSETYKNVIPAYYEIALKEKGVRDEESVEMIDFIMSKRVYDFGYVYDNFQGFGFVIESLVKSGDANFASYYASKINGVRDAYNKMFAIFENYK